MKQETNVNRGEVIFFSSGDYSDYRFVGNVVFLKDCDLLQAKDEFKAWWKSSDNEYAPNEEQFVTWLVAQQIAMPLDCREIHIEFYEIVIAAAEGGKDE